MKTAIFPGSFDPFTVGHKCIVDKALLLFDHVVIAFGVNVRKSPFMPLDERMARVRKAYEDDPRVEVTHYSCLTIDLVRKYNTCYIVRGVRNVVDFEYEKNIADVNQKLADIETIFLLSDPDVALISSSLVRELAGFGKEITEYIV